MVRDDQMMADIMKEIGCGEGFHIPVANEENRSLENEVRARPSKFPLSGPFFPVRVGGGERL